MRSPPEVGTAAALFSNHLGSFQTEQSRLFFRSKVLRQKRRRFFFFFKACATLPFRCASRPESSANVSKIPYLDGPILMAEPGHRFRVGPHYCLTSLQEFLYFRFLSWFRLENHPQSLSVDDSILLFDLSIALSGEPVYLGNRFDRLLTFPAFVEIDEIGNH